MRSHLFRSCILAMLVCAAANSALGEPLDASKRRSVIDSVSGRLLETYVFPDVAARVAEALQEKLEAGAYEIDDPARFAAAVSEDLREFGADRHLGLRHAPAASARSDTSQRTPPSMESMRMFGAGSNFGVVKAEVLHGNVGVLEIASFHPVEFAAQRIADAMAMLADTDALIIDVRRNTGGLPDTVAFLATYFFPEVPRITLMEFRDRGGVVTESTTTAPMVPGRRYLDRPVYVLTSHATVSAGEELAYDLQAHGRATVVGEVTAGAANPGRDHRVHPLFLLFVPTAEAISPKTGANWERSGVQPDLPTPADDAADTAYRAALASLLDSVELASRRIAIERALALLPREAAVPNESR